MIQHPLALVLILLAMESLILYLANHRKYSKLFSFLPSIFWIYFLPMVASSLGLIDPKAPIYSDITKYVLPIALFLLLITVDIKAILRLGPMAVAMFLIGSLGIALGMIVVFLLFKGIVGAHYWSGFGALTGSWTGGSANMIAVKEGLGTPDHVFLPMVIVDTVVPYVWMGIMIAGVSLAPHFDRWNHADRRFIDDLQARIQKSGSSVDSHPVSLLSLIGILGVGMVGGLLSIYLSRFFPAIPGVITAYTWTIIIVSCLGITMSFTPLRKLEAYGHNKIGYFILYFVLTAIGAKATISHFETAAVLIAAGFLVVLIHASILLLAARLLKVPLFLAAVSSQANVGGVASAPVVAEVYQKGFGSVGLLLAILGNLIGTYIGLLTGQICHFLAQ
jgi:uncharacterized membrane protein